MVETAASTSIDIAASAETVYGILTDLSRVSEFSPECYKSEWEDGSTGPEIGAKFRGYNQAGDMKWDAGCVVRRGLRRDSPYVSTASATTAPAQQ